MFAALFEENEGSVAVTFPDLGNCVTQVENMADAGAMAAEVLGDMPVWVEGSGKPIPAPTPPEKLAIPSGGTAAPTAVDTAVHRL